MKISRSELPHAPNEYSRKQALILEIFLKNKKRL